MSTYFYVYPFGVNAASGELEPVSTLDAGTLISYSKGWPINYEQDLLTISTAEPISRQQTNQMFYDITNNINQYQTQGVPFWIQPSQNIPAATPYPYTQYARVVYDAGAGLQIWENQIPNPGVNITIPGADESWLLISGNQQGVQPGTIIDFGGASAPAGYFACDGASKSTTAYPRLFAAIGYLWGGSGANFLLPDLRTYVTAGQGGAFPVISGTAVGSKGGALSHVISITEMPSHNHPSTTPGNGGNGIWLGRPQGTGGGAGLIKASDGATEYGLPLQGGGSAISLAQSTALVLKCIKY